MLEVCLYLFSISILNISIIIVAFIIILGDFITKNIKVRPFFNIIHMYA